MKIAVLLLAALLSQPAHAQNGRPVYLRWKLAPGETLVYNTGMVDQQTKAVATSATGRDSTPTPGGLLQQLLKSIPGAAQQNAYLSYLRPQASGGITIEMTMQPVTDTVAAKNAGVARVAGPKAIAVKPAVVLRGAINKEGSIESFYLKTEQKNLLALLFQLPTGAIKTGDSWPLELNLVSVDQSFRCDSALRRNIVKCIKIERLAGDTLVTLQYDIEEFISGEMPTFSLVAQKTTMKISYTGSAVFSVTRGRWQQYEGLMNYVSEGFMSVDTSKKISLLQP